MASTKNEEINEQVTEGDVAASDANAADFGGAAEGRNSSDNPENSDRCVFAVKSGYSKKTGEDAEMKASSDEAVTGQEKVTGTTMEMDDSPKEIQSDTLKIEILPKQAPIQGEDGKYKRPRGVAPKGMAWDFDKGVWVQVMRKKLITSPKPRAKKYTFSTTTAVESEDVPSATIPVADVVLVENRHLDENGKLTSDTTLHVRPKDEEAPPGAVWNASSGMWVSVDGLDYSAGGRSHRHTKPVRGGDGLYIQPLGKVPPGKIWDPHNGNWIDAASTNSSIPNLDLKRFREDRPRGAVKFRKLRDGQGHEWDSENEHLDYDGPNAAAAAAEDDKGATKSDLEEYAGEVVSATGIVDANVVLVPAAAVALSPSTGRRGHRDSLKGSHPRPRGRGPTGKVWDYETGIWVREEGGLESPKPKARNHSRPVGRPPANKEWDPERGVWIKTGAKDSEYMPFQLTVPVQRPEQPVVPLKRKIERRRRLPSSANKSTDQEEGGEDQKLVGEYSSETDDVVFEADELPATPAAPDHFTNDDDHLRPSSKPGQTLDGKFKRPRGKAPVGRTWDENRGVWVRTPSSSEPVVCPVVGSSPVNGFMEQPQNSESVVAALNVAHEENMDMVEITKFV